MAGTWTYDPALVASTPKYQVRFLMQDVTAARPLMYDEEIAWVLTEEMNVYMAAARCCKTLVAKSGGARSKTIGDLSVDYDVAFYRGLAADLEARGMTYQTPYVGGISIADKLAQEANTDAVQPLMFRGEFNNPGASQPAPGGETNSLTQGPGV